MRTVRTVVHLHLWCGCNDVNNPGPRLSFFREGDLDPDLTQKSCGPTQPTGECTRVIRPCLGLGDALIDHLAQGDQKA